MIAKNIVYSSHALEQMEWRKITKAAVDEVLQSPDSIEDLELGRVALQKLHTEQEKIYVYRVFVDTDRNPNEVVTVYKTIKIDKYRRLQ